MQSPLLWQQGAQAPSVQHLPAPQSASAQQTPVAQLPSQHFLPLPHCASLAQLHDELLHWCVPWSQQLPAVQSPSAWQQVWQAPLVQHLPAPQSPSEQHTPEVHAPPQQTRPPPHCDVLVQAQTLALHWCVPRSQHLPARQSPSEVQPDAHVPSLQYLPEPQSASPQQFPGWQAPPQHLRPLPHWASLLQVQAFELQVWVPGSQHCPARQSPSEQQLPWTQALRLELPVVVDVVVPVFAPVEPAEVVPLEDEGPEVPEADALGPPAPLAAPWVTEVVVEGEPVAPLAVELGDLLHATTTESAKRRMRRRAVTAGSQSRGELVQPPVRVGPVDAR